MISSNPYIYIYMIQKTIIQKNYYFNTFFKNMKMHINKRHMLSSKIEFEMDINHHDELLETIWEHMKETKRGKERGGGRLN